MSNTHVYTHIHLENKLPEAGGGSPGAIPLVSGLIVHVIFILEGK